MCGMLFQTKYSRDDKKPTEMRKAGFLAGFFSFSETRAGATPSNTHTVTESEIFCKAFNISHERQ